MKMRKFLLKKQIAVLMALCAVCFISCSDDDDDIPWENRYAKEISKVYQSSDLKMTLNRNETSGNKRASLRTMDLTSADIAIVNTIPGEDSLIFSNVKLEAAADTKVYTFTAESTNSDRKVSITGRVGNGLNVDVTHEITSKVVGTWVTSLQFYSISLNIVPENPNDSVDLKGLFGYDKVPVVKGGEEASLGDIIGDLGKMAFFYLNPSLELKSDGNLITSWNPSESLTFLVPDLKPGKTEEGLVRYNVNKNMIYPAIEGDLLSGLNTSAYDLRDSGIDQDMLILFDLLQKANTGIPMKLDITNENILHAYVDKEMMSPYVATLVKYVLPIAEGVDAGELGAAFGVTGEGLAALLSEFNRLVYESKSIELRVSLQRFEEEVPE